MRDKLGTRVYQEHSTDIKGKQKNCWMSLSVQTSDTNNKNNKIWSNNLDN